MTLGNQVFEEKGNVTGVRVLSSDASSGTNLEICIRTTGSIRGVAHSSMWTYTQLTRPDGSVLGRGVGVLTTVEGDVIHLTGSGSGETPPAGGTINFRVAIHCHSSAAKYSDLNSIILVGNYLVAADGSTEFTTTEWK